MTLGYRERHLAGFTSLDQDHPRARLGLLELSIHLVGGSAAALGVGAYKAATVREEVGYVKDVVCREAARGAPAAERIVCRTADHSAPKGGSQSIVHKTSQCARRENVELAA
jgi:hypothetical protein